MIDIAVLLPLQEARGFGTESLRAWCGQTLDRSRYRLVFLAPGEGPGLEVLARSVMAPHDRWHAIPGANEYALFNAGAEIAGSPWLFLTEVHCAPDPDCLERMLDHLARTGQPGARGASVGVGHGRLGELERATYDSHLRPGGEEDHWRKVLIHSLAIRTDVYRAAGGMPSRFGDFSGWALAIALRERGHHLGCAADAVVRHHYTGEVGELLAHVRDFALGEMRYWSEMPAPVCLRYMDEPEEWAQRGIASRVGSRRLLRLLLRARLVRALCSRTTASLSASALLGPRSRWIAARAKLLRRRLRMAVESRRANPSDDAYLALWEACARAGRWEYLVRHPAPRTMPTSLGLYAEEIFEGTRFHWTGPVASFDLDAALCGGPCEIRVLPVRGQLRDVGFRVLLDGRPAAAALDGSALRVDVPNGGPHTLGLVIHPLRPRRQGVRDGRELGLPVCDVRRC